MKKNTPITQIMTAEVKTVHTAQKVSEVSHLLSENQFHHVPVVSGKKVVGMISSIDLMKKSFEQFGSNTRMNDVLLDQLFSIQDVMNPDVRSLTDRQSVRDAVLIFGEGKFHSLPVVDQNNDLVGIVTTTDVFGYLLEQYF